MISTESVKSIDRSEMFRCISDFPAQVEEAIKIGNQMWSDDSNGPFEGKHYRMVVELGDAFMGSLQRARQERARR